MPLNPFSNLGIRTPSIQTPQLPAIFKPYMTTPTPASMSTQFTAQPAQYAPLPPTQWGKLPDIKIPTQQVIPTNAPLPQGYSVDWGLKTPLWLTPAKPMPPAPTMQKLTATPVKTPVLKSKTK